MKQAVEVMEKALVMRASRMATGEEEDDEGGEEDGATAYRQWKWSFGLIGLKANQYNRSNGVDSTAHVETFYWRKIQISMF